VLKVDVKGYQGSIQRSAEVYSNDPAHPQIKLNILVSVDVPVTIEPRGVMLGGTVGDEISQVVVLKGHMDKPLELDQGTNSLPDKVAYEVTTVKKGKEYRVTFRNISRVEDDKYSGTVMFRTNYPEQPEITIQCLGYIWKQGTVIPSIDELEQNSKKPEKTKGGEARDNKKN